MSKINIKYWADKSVDYAIGFFAGGGTLKMGTIFLSINPFYIWLVSILIGMVAWHWSTIIRQTKNRKPKKLEEIFNRTFSNETVVLNKKFIKCQFDGCTFEYKGDDFEFYQETNLLREDCRFKFDTIESSVAAHIIHDFFVSLSEKNMKFLLWDNYGIARKKSGIILK